MQAPTTKIDNTETTSFFGIDTKSVQKKINACIKKVNQNPLARQTIRAVDNYAPTLIAFIGSMFAPAAVTFGCCAAVVALHLMKPKLISEQAVGKVAIGIGASIGLTKLVIPFSKLLTYAAVSGGLIFFGFQAANTPQYRTVG